MDNRIFGNLMASRPASERRRWVVWLLVALAHVIVIGAIIMIPIWSRRDDEVVEIFHEPMLLQDVQPEITPLPEREVKPAEGGTVTTPVPRAPTNSRTDGARPTR